MIHAWNLTSPLRRQAAALSGLVAVLVFVSAGRAATLDFNVPSGNYTVAGNWVDATTRVPAAAPPTYVDNTTFDDAYVRNGGTLTINSDVSNHLLRIGATPAVALPDYNGNGAVDAADYVLWRKGGTLLNDATPGTGPDDYTTWRAQFGNSGSGTLNWTAGKIYAGNGILEPGDLGFTPPPTDTTTYYGPDIRLGQHIAANPAGSPPTPEIDYTGTVTQNGATTELDLLHTTSRLNIGESGTSSNPTSTYNLVNGTIALVVGYTVPFVGDTQGANGNNGINIKSGIFNMSGGQIIDKTVEVAAANGVSNPNIVVQRFMTIASSSGTDASNLNYSTANFTGGTVSVLGGIRVATGSNSRGFLNIMGPVTMSLGEDLSVGYNVTNGVGVMNMSDGQLTVGTATSQKRLQIGHRGNGTLNLSGGSITVSGDLRVGAQTQSPDSLVNVTGGSLTTRQLQMQLQPPGSGGTPTILIDGPTANFVQGPNGGVDQASIGQQGPAIFEVRQGQASLNQVELGTVNSNGTTSSGTINLKGGRLKITGSVLKTDGNATPTVNLTGGTLEITPFTAGIPQWQTSLNNTGSKLVLNPNNIQQVTMSTTGAALSNFSMSSGSWDVELGSGTTASGADRFIVNGSGTASLTGGMLNISRINGYSPNINDTLTILQGGGGATLNAGAVTLTGDPGWGLISNATQIQLKYFGMGSGSGLSTAAVPEPSSAALVVLAALGLLSSKRTRASIGA